MHYTFAQRLAGATSCRYLIHNIFTTITVITSKVLSAHSIIAELYFKLVTESNNSKSNFLYFGKNTLYSCMVIPFSSIYFTISTFFFFMCSCILWASCQKTEQKCYTLHSVWKVWKLQWTSRRTPVFTVRTSAFVVMLWSNYSQTSHQWTPLRPWHCVCLQQGICLRDMSISQGSTAFSSEISEFGDKWIVLETETPQIFTLLHEIVPQSPK